MRVDRAANKAGFFDNMGSRPITSGEWHEYDIVGDVDEDAEVLNIGMILPGKGKAWLDAVSVEDLGKLVVRSEPPRPLSGRGLENLIAFTRLLGYVRHFHPSDEANATAWDAFAVDGMLAVESARNADELAERLGAIFHRIGPTVRVFPTGKAVPPASEPAPAANTPGLGQVHRPTRLTTVNEYARLSLIAAQFKAHLIPTSHSPRTWVAAFRASCRSLCLLMQRAPCHMRPSLLRHKTV
jgi:hypothetical protein